MKVFFYFTTIIYVVLLSGCSAFHTVYQGMKGRDVLTYVNLQTDKTYHFALTHKLDSSLYNSYIGTCYGPHFATQFIPLQKKHGSFFSYFLFNDSSQWVQLDFVTHLGLCFSKVLDKKIPSIRDEYCSE